METKEGDNLVIMEGEMHFCRGSPGDCKQFDRCYCVLYKNILVAYSDNSKFIETFRVFVKTSWITIVRENKENFFILHTDDKEKNVFLLQLSSTNSHRVWLRYFQQTNWRISAITEEQYHHFFRQKKFDQWKGIYESFHSINSLHDSINELLGREMSEINETRLYKTSSQWDIQIESSAPYKRQNGHPMEPSLVYSPQDTHPIDILVSYEKHDRNYKETLTSGDGKEDLTSNWHSQAYSFPPPGSTIESMTNGHLENKNIGKSTGLNNTKNMKVDIENNFQDVFDERGIFQEAMVNNLSANSNQSMNYQDLETTPKMDKKVSVGQFISNIKSKFGSTASRKKAKKNNEKKTTDVTYSSRLLWNDNGDWLDRWFYLSNGVLAGYKDTTSAKPAEIEIDLNECIISTISTSNGILKKLNLFQLERKDGGILLFMAWSIDQYFSWIESLSSVTDLKDTSFDLQFKTTYNGEDVTDGDIIPYDHSVNEEEQKETSSSSETSVHARIDSIDSGNDGDESGLESSLRSNKRLLEYRKKIERERKSRGMRSSSFSETLENNDTKSIDLLELSAKNNIKKLDLSRQLSRESTSTENDLRSPTLEQPPNIFNSYNESTFSKKKRSSFIQKKWNLFDKPKKLELSDIRKTPSPSPLKGDLLDNGPLTPCSTESPPLKRPDSLDISSVDNLSMSTWDGFETHNNRYKQASVGSEDDASDTYSVPSMIDDKSQEDIEDSLREETLLRTRRNSLTLERSQVANKLQVFREKRYQIDEGKSSKKQKNPKPIPKEKTDEQQQEKIAVLEQKLENIDTEIENIDKRLYLQRFEITPNENNKTNQMNSNKKTNPTQPVSRIKLNDSGQRYGDANSMSVDNLSNISSKDKKDSIYHNNNNIHFETRALSKPQKIPNFVRLSDSGESSGGHSQCSGIEELMITTQRLESSSSSANTPQEPTSSPGMWRSKSLGAMELLKSKPKQKLDCNENNADLIIEDFEKFSEMLTNQMKLQQVNGQQQVDV